MYGCLLAIAPWSIALAWYALARNAPNSSAQPPLQTTLKALGGYDRSFAAW
jgi:hypothetical protein